MKLHHLRDFEAVARCGSLRAAARELALAQPSLTRSIQQLETELGASLFQRSARGAVPTPAGQAFLLRARAALNELRRGESEVRQMSGGGGGGVGMAISAAMAVSVLPPALQAFCERFPDAAVRVVPAQPLSMLPELRAGTLDFAMGPRPAMPLGDDFDVEHLLNVRCTVVCRKGHRLQRIRTLSRLIGERWLVSSATGMMATDHDRFFLSQGLAVPTRVVQCDNSTAMMSLLASTDMLAILPRQWMEADLSRGVYAEIALDGALPEVEIVLVSRRGLPLTPTADAMLTLLRRQLGYPRAA